MCGLIHILLFFFLHFLCPIDYVDDSNSIGCTQDLVPFTYLTLPVSEKVHSVAVWDTLLGRF